MFNLFQRNKQEVEKVEQFCVTCGCFFKRGFTLVVRVPRSMFNKVNTQDYCLSCAPKFDTIIFEEKGVIHLKNNVECDENGIPLIGLEKYKSK